MKQQVRAFKPTPRAASRRLRTPAYACSTGDIESQIRASPGYRRLPFGM